jgi:redox-sensing transcriptional repressor
VRRLLEELHQILGLERKWTMVVVGVGQLGRAVLSYGGFVPQGFRIVDAFDADPTVIGQQVDHLIVKSVEQIREALVGRPVDIGIVATPAVSAQKVIDTLVECGVRAILNYAPIAAHVPPHVRVKDIDPVLSLQSMTFYLKNEAPPATAS